MRLGVIGAGYVGLVTGACLAKLGHSVTCVELDPDRVERLSQADLPITEPGLEPLVTDALSVGRLRFTTDATELHGAQLVIVAVGTLDSAGAWTVDLVRKAVLGIAADRAAPRSIVIRSTLLPGTAARLAHELSVTHGDVRLAVNPEFTRQGTAVADFLAPDRVVIGTDDETGRMAEALRQLYAPLGADIMVTDLTSAEMIKVASNVFLAAKITFANELARLCEATGADVAAVADGIGLDRRIGRAFLTPGPGYGGSCLPSQARALPAVAEAAGVQVPLMASIARSDEYQADWLIGLAEAALDGRLAGRRITVLGMTFKAGTDDLRESPALRLIARLTDRGALVTAHDPIASRRGVSMLASSGVKVESADSAKEACRGADAVFIATEWPEYRALDWEQIKPLLRGSLIVDGRGIVDAKQATAAGLRIVGLPGGSPSRRPVTDSFSIRPGHRNGSWLDLEPDSAHEAPEQRDAVSTG